MIEIASLSEEQLDPIRHLIPGPDPKVVPHPETGKIIPVAAPRLDGNELKYLTECITTSWVSSAGRFVREFEESFARAVGCEYGIACCNGTVALHLALAALGIGPGDEVILPAFTMIATANAVVYTGASAVLVDAESGSWNLDPTLVEKKITNKTKAVVVVHTYGRPADMDALLEICAKHGLHLVEDAAEAHGALYHGQPVGSLGRLGTFSFYANKIITTGEGGMVTTSDPEIAAVARRLRDHAFSSERHFWHEYVGFNYRMTNLQAAVGLAQTERMSELVQARIDHAAQYSQLLHGIEGLELPSEGSGTRNVFWMYSLLVNDDFGCSRDELRAKLALKGIETRTFFIPIHFQPIYFSRFKGQRFDVAERLCQRGLYLPSGSSLTSEEIRIVADAIGEARNSR